MPSRFVTRIQAAPIRSRYSSAWSSTFWRSRLVTSRSRNCGTCALTALMPANVRVRPSRNASTAPRVLLRARWMDASAVRLAWMDVTPNVMPSTTTTSRAEATKPFAKRPNAGLIALVPGVGGILLPVFVLVVSPLVAACVERDAQISRAGGGHNHVLHDFARDALVPHGHAVVSRKDVLDREGPVRARLRVVAIRHHYDVRHHSGVHVAVHTHEARAREGV